MLCEADFTSNARLVSSATVTRLAVGEKCTRCSSESPGAGVGVNPSDFTEQPSLKVKDTDVMRLQDASPGCDRKVIRVGNSGGIRSSEDTTREDQLRPAIKDSAVGDSSRRAVGIADFT